MEVKCWNTVKVLSAPLHVNILLTSRCNLICKHCFIPVNERVRKGMDHELSREEIRRLLIQLKQLKVFQIDLGGGEPLLREDFFNVLENIENIKMKILTLNTNGTLCSKSLVADLSKFNIGMYIISLDGSNEEIFGEMRGDRKAFPKVLAGIRNVISKGLKVKLSTIITRINYRDIGNIITLARELGVSGVRFNHLFFTPVNLLHYNSLMLNAEQHLEVMHLLNEFYQKWGEFISGTYLQSYKLIKEMQKKHSLNKKEILPCPAGTTKCTIRSDGSVIPCEILYDEVIGNVKEQTLEKIWRDNKRWLKFRAIYKIKPASYECSICDFYSLCYQGHRCWPYYIPEGIEWRKMYCIMSVLSKEKE